MIKNGLDTLYRGVHIISNQVIRKDLQTGIVQSMLAGLHGLGYSPEIIVQGLRHTQLLQRGRQTNRLLKFHLISTWYRWHLKQIVMHHSKIGFPEDDVMKAEILESRSQVWK